MNLHQLLKAMIDQRAESLHVTSGAPPLLKIGGEWVPLKAPPLTPVETKTLLSCVLTDAQQAGFEQEGVVHFSFGVKELSRFLATGYGQRGACAAVFSPVPFRVPDPPAWVANTVSQLGPGPGLLLAAGPRLHASAVLAWWVDHLNRTRAARIVTVEEPITVLHPHKQAVVDQVEVGADCQPQQARALVRCSGADVVAIDLIDGLGAALDALAGGALVLCALRAASTDAAHAVKASLPAHVGPLVRSLVFVDVHDEATLL
ncbi:MAG: hypothetical protein JNJ54_22245 [Myxococcaceae bacterium]|nr:hypothetical protein [Myxococcaceae bacterium]